MFYDTWAFQINFQKASSLESCQHITSLTDEQGSIVPAMLRDLLWFCISRQLFQLI